MRALVASLSKKTLTTLFAATLAFGLVPASAFAASDSLQSIPEGSEGTASVASSTEGGSADVFSHCPSDDVPSVDGGGASTSSEDVSNMNEAAYTSVDGDVVIPAAAERVNHTMPLEVVAKQESVRNYFLAHTLESTRTIPVVSANLPLDTGITSGEADEEEAVEGNEDSEESDLPGTVAVDSTVVGSFEYRGMTFVIEEGGESVALMAIDYGKLPEEFIREQVVIIPATVTNDTIDFYSVTRIADHAFSSLTQENADPGYMGCEVLFSDDDLIFETGIVQFKVEAFLKSEEEMIDIDGDGNDDDVANPLAGCAGVLILDIPASVTTIEDDAFEGCDTLQYIMVEKDNSDYASYDGALYDADLTRIQYVPEGRVGALRIGSSVVELESTTFSSCPLLKTVIIDPGDETLKDLATRSLTQQVLVGASSESLSDSIELLLHRVLLNDERDTVYTTSRVSLNAEPQRLTIDLGGGTMKCTNSAAHQGETYTGTPVFEGARYISVFSNGSLQFNTSDGYWNAWDLTRSGYRFSYWSGTLSGNNVYLANTGAVTTSGVVETPTAPSNLVAHWLPNLTIDLGGATMKCTDSVGHQGETYTGTPVFEGVSHLTLSSNGGMSFNTSDGYYNGWTLTRPGYRFSYWSGTLSGNNAYLANNFNPPKTTETIVIPTAPSNLVAHWLPNLTIDLGGATMKCITSGAHQNETYTGSPTFEGVSYLTLASNGTLSFNPSDGTYTGWSLSRPGYRFSYWSGTLSGNNAYLANNFNPPTTTETIVEPTAPSNLVAHWAPNLTIDLGGGTMKCTNSAGHQGETYTGTPVFEGVTHISAFSNGALHFNTYDGYWNAWELSRIGYRFSHWTGSDELMNNLGTVIESPSEPLNLTAHWVEQNDFTVNFKVTVTGSTTTNKTYTDQKYESASFKSPSATAAAVRGYTLLGWSKTNPGTSVYASLPAGCYAADAALTVKQLYGSDAPPTTCDLFGIYKLDDHTISLDHDGGAFTSAALSSLQSALGTTGSVDDAGTTITYNVRTNAFSIPASTKSGYTFDGWKSGSSSVQMPIDPKDASFSPIDYAFKAAWTTNGYSIRLEYVNAKGQTVDCGNLTDKESLSFDKDFGDSYTVVLGDPDRTGYEFTGWSGPGLVGDANKGGVAIMPNTQIAAADANSGMLVYTAHWKLLDHGIHYDLNETNEDGKGSADAYVYKASLPGDEPTSYSYDETGTASPIALPTSSEVTRPGYLFSHWYEGDDEDDVVIEIDPKERTEDVYLKAAWAPLLSAIVPVETSKVVNFEIDTVSGTTKDFQDDDEAKVVELSTTTPHGVYLSAASTVNPDHELGEMLFPKIGEDRTEIDALIDSLGFFYATDESSDVDTTKPASFSFSAKGTIADDDRILMIGSEKLLSANAVSLGQSKARGRIKLMMEQDGSFTDLLIPIDRIGIATDYEGPTRFADIVWTIELAKQNWQSIMR